MRRLCILAVGLGVLGVALLSAHALEGDNGYEATEVFRWGDIRGSIQYDESFSGVEWDEMTSSGLGDRWSDLVVADSNGTLYYLAFGYDWVDNENSVQREYTGLIRSDGTDHVQLVQEDWIRQYQVGEKLIAVVMAPVTHGLLTADHPVVIRESFTAWGAEVVSVNPSTGAETVVYTFEALEEGGGTPQRIALHEDGRIFALITDDNTIHVLEWNGSDYDESVLSTSVDASSSIRVGGDGYLYTFNADQGLWFNGSSEDKEIIRIDPDTGASSVYAHVQSGRAVWDWTFDSDGQLWVVLREHPKGRGKNPFDYVAPVAEGGVTSLDDAISSDGAITHGLAAGPAATDGSVGPLYVLIWGGDGSNDTIWQLTPGEDDGGGNGNGNGKGKNK